MDLVRDIKEHVFKIVDNEQARKELQLHISYAQL